MRIRMTSARNGTIDGVNLDVFQVGHTYDVDQSIASYLIVTGAAEPAEGEPALVVRGGGSEVFVSMAPDLRPDMAADVLSDPDDPAA